MTKDEVYEFVAKYPVFCLATAADNKPFVRGMMAAKVADGGIYFSTGADKDVCKQLLANPAVEMCFFSKEADVQVRVNGQAELQDDLELKKEIVAKFPFLEPWIEQAGYEAMMIFCVKGGKAVTWTMETNAAPKKYIDL